MKVRVVFKSITPSPWVKLRDRSNKAGDSARELNFLWESM